jgi:hypothetical protein
LKFNSSLSIAFTPGFEKLAGAPDNPLYLVDSDPIELCDLRPRHPVGRQGADATELGDRYLGGASGHSVSYLPATMVPSPRRLPHTISPLEGDGFEPSVPELIRSRFRDSSRLSHNGLMVSRPGTEGSNPSPSSRQSVSLPQPLSKVENPAFRAGLSSWLGDRVSRDSVGVSISRQPGAISLSGIFQYRGAAGRGAGLNAR